MEEKERREALKALYKKKEEIDFIHSLPISADLFRELFNYLDGEIDDRSESSFVYTKRFCDQNNIEFSVLEDWLLNNSAGDDSEILWNVEEKFEDL